MMKNKNGIKKHTFINQSNGLKDDAEMISFP